MVTQVFYTGMPGPLEREKLNDLWNRQSGEFTSTSVSSVLMGTGAKSFQVQAGKAYVVGQRIGMLALSAPANYMLGTVSSYAGTTLGVTVDEVSGAGTHATWLICTSTEFPAASAAVMAEFGKRALGAHQFLSYNRGSVLCHVGDSNTVARPAYRDAYEAGWLGVGGVFEGWTSYNLGANGSTAGSWVADIATGNQGEAPADYVAGGPRGGQPWQVVNAKPDVIILSLGTNDIRWGAGPGSIAAKTVQFRANMATLINFFLVRTNASIVLRLPQPLVFANPDPDGYTDCINADDAAARSAAMRTVYLEWMNQSDRVKVVDLHKHLFGYRIDSLGASVDPETGGAMMGDTLHPVGLGYMRQIQIIAKTLSPGLPYTTKVNAVGPAVFKDAAWARTYLIVGSGANFIDVSRNPQDAMGSIARDSIIRPPLRNIEMANLLGRAAALTRQKELEALGEVYAFFHSDGATVGPFTIALISDFALNGYCRLNTSAAAFGGRTGDCTFYAVTPKNGPTYLPQTSCIALALNGPMPLTTTASGSTNPPYPSAARTFSIANVRASREDFVSAAEIALHVGNEQFGGFQPGSIPYPGKLLGTVSFNAFHRSSRFSSPSWVADPTNFPGGVASFNLGAGVTLNAVCTSGTLGDYCQLIVDPL